jgi:hypothetical protein
MPAAGEREDILANQTFVMPGLDPGIDDVMQQIGREWPGQARP